MPASNDNALVLRTQPTFARLCDALDNDDLDALEDWLHDYRSGADATE